jgi:hypothetical protein
MGAIRPSKMPGAKTKARRDDTDFTQYAFLLEFYKDGSKSLVFDIGSSFS